MKPIRVRDVNEALSLGVSLIQTSGDSIIIAPRGEQVTLEFGEPVTTIYEHPIRRVLFDAERDANPFFHLMEALWILAGRQDVEWLAQYNKQMREYSDDGEIFHAPYGYRLRYEYGFDQISRVITLLRKEPDTRRAVLSIWHPVRDLGIDSKDIPCNDMIFFKVRGGKLNMTVHCRSNDMIWGAYGANAVQFSMLQEYIAAMVGVNVGAYRQVSDSLHVYVDTPVWKRLKYKRPTNSDGRVYEDLAVYPTSLVQGDPDTWLKELKRFMLWTGDTRNIPAPTHEPFFETIAIPAFIAWQMHRKQGATVQAIEFLKKAMPEWSDWRLAMIQWLERRVK